MCGRYVSPEDAAIERTYDLRGQKAARFTRAAFTANYNTSPTQPVPIMRDAIRLDGARERELVAMRWGLIPSFAGGDPGPYATFNARIETVRSSPAYRGAWQKGQRCLVLAAGFYEWQAQPPDWQRAIQHYITLKDREVFAMAGLWDESITADGEVIISCTIITMPANELMSTIHNSKKAGSKRVLLPEDKRRMPMILQRDDEEAWLRGTEAEAWELLKQFPSEQMRAQPVKGKTVADRPPELL